MRLETATLSLEPRTAGACIDLAVLFYRAHAVRFLGLSLLFGSLPIAFGVYRADAFGDGWLWSLLLFFFLSPFLGATVVAAAGHRVFGEPFTVRGALRQVWARMGTLFFFLPVARLLLGLTGLLCVGLLWVPLAARYGYMSEVILLEQLGGGRMGRRLEEILRHSWTEACGSYISVAVFAGALVVTLFLTLDLGSQLLLGVPILVGRVSWAMAFDDVSNLLVYDPRPLAVWFACCWLVYPLARLAWFFCYLDARIRSEGWDVEIAFRVEARRLARAV